MRIRTKQLLVVTGALCALMLAVAPASAFRGGDGGRGGGGGRPASPGARSSGGGSGSRPSAARPLAGNPARLAGQPSAGYRGSVDRGRGSRPKIQLPDRGQRNGSPNRIGRAFPSQPANTGSRFAGNDRGGAPRGRGSYGGSYRGWNNGHGHHGHDHHDGHCGGGHWRWPYYAYPGSFFYFGFSIPTPIFITSPFYCGLCGIGFAGNTFFYNHIHYAHAVPIGDIDPYLYTVDGRIVFNGY